MRNAALLLMFLAVCVYPPSAGAGGEETLSLLIQRAREHEELLDGVQADFSEESSYSYRSGKVENKSTGTWTKLGDRMRIDTTSIRRRNDDEQERSLTYVIDRNVLKTLSSSDGNNRGSVQPLFSGQRRTGLSPDAMGVTALPNTSGTLLDRLEERTSEISYSRNGETVESKTDWTSSVAGEVMLDGRMVILVEVVETVSGGHSTNTSHERIYFDPELDYAVVKFERGRKRNGSFRSRENWTFEDFREVRGGLQVPFKSLRRSRANKDAPVNLTFSVESMDFPGAFDGSLFQPGGRHPWRRPRIPDRPANH